MKVKQTANFFVVETPMVFGQVIIQKFQSNRDLKWKTIENDLISFFTVSCCCLIQAESNSRQSFSPELFQKQKDRTSYFGAKTSTPGKKINPLLDTKQKKNPRFMLYRSSLITKYLAHCILNWYKCFILTTLSALPQIFQTCIVVLKWCILLYWCKTVKSNPKRIIIGTKTTALFLKLSRRFFLSLVISFPYPYLT